MKEKPDLEVLELQVMLGKEKGVPEHTVSPGFFDRLSTAVQNFLKEEGIEHLALHQRFTKDNEYQGVDRQFHLNRCKTHA
jgi:hypothetical protein